MNVVCSAFGVGQITLDQVGIAIRQPNQRLLREVESQILYGVWWPINGDLDSAAFGRPDYWAA